MAHLIPQGGTYAGNPVSCAAAVAVSEAIEEEKVLDNVVVRYMSSFVYLRSAHVSFLQITGTVEVIEPSPQ